MSELNKDNYINKSFDASNAFFSLQMDSIRFLEEVFNEKVWENEFYYVKDGYAKIFIPKGDLEKIRKLFEQRIKDNPDFFNKLYKIIESRIIQFRKSYLDYLNQIEIKATAEELKEWIRDFHKEAQSVTGYAYITDGIGLDYEAWLPFLPITKEEFIEVVRPLKNSFTKEFEYNLAKLKLNKQVNIDDFVKEYSWIENSYSSVDKLTVDILNEKLNLMSINNANEIVANYNNEGLDISHESLLLMKGFNSLQLSIALSLCRAIDLQDSRKEVVFRTNSILQKAYKKLFKFYKYSTE